MCRMHVTNHSSSECVEERRKTLVSLHKSLCDNLLLVRSMTPTRSGAVICPNFGVWLPGRPHQSACHVCREQRANPRAPWLRARPTSTPCSPRVWKRRKKRERYHRPRHIARGHIARGLFLYLYTDELDFGDTVTLLVDVLRTLRKAKELELTRVYNHFDQHCQCGLRAQNTVLLFMQTDEYPLEGLQESTLRYLSVNFNTIRADSKAKHTLARLSERSILMTEVMSTDVWGTHLKSFIGATCWESVTVSLFCSSFYSFSLQIYISFSLQFFFRIHKQ